MPDHHTPDLADLDAAFRRLEQDIAGSSSPRGARAAIASARRRRRTTYGAIAAVAVLVVGGAAVGQGLGGYDRAVGPLDQPLPPPVALTAEAFSAATAGWVDGWGKPSTQAGTLAAVRCLGNHGSAFDDATRAGETVYGAGSQEIAYVVGMEFPGDRIHAANAAATAAAADCKPSVSRTTTYADGSQVTFYQLPATGDGGDVQLWTARHDDRLALAVIAGTTSTPTADVIDRVDDLLTGGLQVDSTFTSVSGGETIDSGSASGGSGPKSGSDYSTVSETEFAKALGSWPNGWQESATKSTSESLACAGDWASSSGSGTGASLGANGEQDSNAFDSPVDAAAAAEALAANLDACASSPATVTQVAGTGTAPVTVVVGSGDHALVTWILQRGPTVSFITIPGSTTPPEAVSEAVGRLMGDALAKSAPKN